MENLLIGIVAIFVIVSFYAGLICGCISFCNAIENKKTNRIVSYVAINGMVTNIAILVIAIIA